MHSVATSNSKESAVSFLNCCNSTGNDLEMVKFTDPDFHIWPSLIIDPYCQSLASNEKLVTGPFDKAASV